MITAPKDGGVFAALVDERKRIVEYLEQHMRTTLGGMRGYLPETAAYVLAAPGKLLRPLLLIDACRAAGGDPNVVFPAAAGTEYGHIASLVHDDIMDGDELRRGRPTLHTKYDVPTALLTGDFLIFQTFLCYTDCRERGVNAECVLAAIRMLSQACIQMCAGQSLEAEIAGALETPKETYLRLICLKTASVCRAAAGIGACLADAPERVVEELAEYGANLGMAFQIVDDMLAYDGSSLSLGKPIGSDMRNHRVTLPIIYALQDGEAGVQGSMRELLGARDVAAADGHAGHDGHDTRRELVQLLHSAHALERSHALAHSYTARAKQHLDHLQGSEAREHLRALADMLLARDH
jgi:geranylgeranyl pyrophosphate synthase